MSGVSLSQPPPRILLIANGAPPERSGGAEIVAWRLATAVADEGGPAAVQAPDDTPDARHRVLEPRERDGVALYTLGTSRGRDHHPRAREAASRVLGLWRPDVIWVHHPSGLGLGAIEVAASAGLPLAVTFHDYWWFCPRGQLLDARGHRCPGPDPQRCPDCLAPGAPRPLRGIARALTAHSWAARQARAQTLLLAATRLTAPSDHVADRYRRWLSREVEVLRNPPPALRRLPPPPPTGPIRIGYFGSLLPSKGVDVLARAVRRGGPGRARLELHRAQPRGPRWQPWPQPLRGLAAAARARWMGPYPQGELDRRLAGVEVVAVPSLWEENAPLVIDEARAAGRPVLASAVGGAGERLDTERMDRLLPPGDVAAWASALVDPRDLRRRLAAALHRPPPSSDRSRALSAFVRRLAAR